MNAAAIAARCAPGVAIEVVAETGSTNADLLARCAGLAGPTLLIAEHQFAGRGRSGRSWLSAPGASLTFSLAWPFAQPVAALAGLPLAVGLAVAEALGRLGVTVQLKWPNDLLKDGAKLGGILIETQAATPGVWAVIGIGLNLDLPDAIEHAIGQNVANAPWLARMDRDTLMATLTDALASMLRQFSQHGFAPLCARWNALHAYQSMAVAILDRGATLHEGLAAGVDDSGQLLLDTPDGRISVISGDVSLRLAQQ